MSHTALTQYQLSLSARIAQDKAAHTEKTDKESNCYTLVKHFIRANSNWSIDSMVSYMLKEYAPYHITPKIISECLYDYIHDKY